MATDPLTVGSSPAVATWTGLSACPRSASRDSGGRRRRRTASAGALLGQQHLALEGEPESGSRPWFATPRACYGWNEGDGTRREFVSALKAELPASLANLQRGNIAPVDLAQAAIGPGMAVYTRYARVLDARGKPLSVREALTLINATLDEALAEQEGDFDAD